MRTEADEGGLLRAAATFCSAASFAAGAVVAVNAELRIVGGLLGSRTTLVSVFLAVGTFVFSIAVVVWRGLDTVGTEVAIVEVGADVRVLADEEPVPCAAADGLALEPEPEDDAALRTGLFGSAGEGRGEVVVDFDGGRVRFFPDLVVGAALFEVNIDFVGDFGAGAALGTTGFGFGFGFGFGSALTGFAGSSTSFSVGIESSGFSGITSTCLAEASSKLGGKAVPIGREKDGAVYPFRVSRSCFLRFASSSGCFWAVSPGSFSLALSKGPPKSLPPSETETTGLIGLDGDGFSPRIGLLFAWTATKDVLTLPSGLGPGLCS